MFNLNYCIMKTIGLVGVSAVETTIAYVKAITEFMRDYTCRQQDPQMIIAALDFQRVKKLRAAGQWSELIDSCSNAISYDMAAQDLVLICSNEMHRFYADIQELSMEDNILSIVDTTVDYVLQQNYQKVLLLGTKPTMCEDFYVTALTQKGIDVVVPTEKEQDEVERVIEELCEGIVCEKSRISLCRIVREVYERESGIQAVVLANTELPMILPAHLVYRWVRLPVVNTLRVHAEAAVKFALGLS